MLLLLLLLLLLFLRSLSCTRTHAGELHPGAARLLHPLRVEIVASTATTARARPAESVHGCTGSLPCRSPTHGREPGPGHEVLVPGPPGPATRAWAARGWRTWATANRRRDVGPEGKGNWAPIVAKALQPCGDDQ